MVYSIMKYKTKTLKKSIQKAKTTNALSNENHLNHVKIVFVDYWSFKSKSFNQKAMAGVIGSFYLWSIVFNSFFIDFWNM